MKRRMPCSSVTRDIATDWPTIFDGMWNLAGKIFSRSDTRSHGKRYVRGLLGDVERKSGWQVAEYLGDDTPYAIQHLLGRSSWDADAARDEILRYSREHLLAPWHGWYRQTRRCWPCLFSLSSVRKQAFVRAEKKGENLCIVTFPA